MPAEYEVIAAGGNADQHHQDKRGFLTKGLTHAASVMHLPGAAPHISNGGKDRGYDEFVEHEEEGVKKTDFFRNPFLAVRNATHTVVAPVGTKIGHGAHEVLHHQHGQGPGVRKQVKRGSSDSSNSDVSVMQLEESEARRVERMMENEKRGSRQETDENAKLPYPDEIRELDIPELRPPTTQSYSPSCQWMPCCRVNAEPARPRGATLMAKQEIDSARSTDGLCTVWAKEIFNDEG